MRILYEKLSGQGYVELGVDPVGSELHNAPAVSKWYSIFRKVGPQCRVVTKDLAVTDLVVGI